MKKILILIPFLFLGCAEKTVYKKIYIQPKYPKLKLYEFNKSITLNVKNHNKFVCIKEWKGCIPKEKFVELVKYIKELKMNNLKYTNEIKKYNNFIKRKNSN